MAFRASLQLKGSELRDFPLRQEMRRGSLKIFLSRLALYNKVPFPINIFFRLGKAGSHCVTKGRSFLRADLFLCDRAVFLLANFTSERYFLKIAAG